MGVGDSEGQAREYETVRGQRAEFRLADGTRVVLAAASHLTVPANYGAGARDVRLRGEAYFDVVHDDRRPFVVHASRAVVRDVGTRFSVRAYGDQQPVRVVVTQGSVHVGNSTTSGDIGPLLERGDLANVHAGGRTTVTRGVDTTQFVAWTGGVLVFDRTPVREAIEDIGRWYDVEFIIADTALEQRTLSGTFRDQLLSDALSLLARSLDTHSELHGRTVTLGARTAAHSR